MKQLTVKDLADQLNALVAKGQGDKMIILSDDNEGNGYHGAFEGAISIANEGELSTLIMDSTTRDVHKLVLVY